MTDNGDDLVRFVVRLSGNGEEAFATNLFRLAAEEEELFVSINNTGLPVGDYTVELQDTDGNVSASVDYSISE